MPVPEVVGRDLELARLRGMLQSAVEGRGGALVLRGPVGVGKTTLLAEVARMAVPLGARVLSTTGVHSEVHLPFSGLYGLLRPFLAHSDRLPAPQREALESVFGRAPGGAPDAFLVSLAALELLSEGAAETPLLLLVDDAQWLDAASATAVGFVARRVEWESVLVLLAVRDDAPGVAGASALAEVAGLPVLPVGGLDATSAAAVLDAVAPELRREVRARVLSDAAGNPLALVELPTALGTEQVSPAASLPLTQRLLDTFGSRLDDLSSVTRTVLLAAALDDGEEPAAAWAAAGHVLGRTVGSAKLQPAVSLRLVELVPDHLRFTHPLVRAAVLQRSTDAERRGLHAALALSTTDQDRRVWHRAAASDGEDDALSAEMRELAHRYAAQGTWAAAVTALERAADLSTTTAGRAGALLQAARLAYNFGRRDEVARLVGRLTPQSLPAHLRPMWGYLNSQATSAPWSNRSAVPEAARAAEEFLRLGEVGEAVDVLVSVALSCWFSRVEQSERDLVLAATDALPLPSDHPINAFITTFVDPVSRGRQALELAAQTPPEAVGGEGLGAYLVGYATLGAWAPDLGLPLLAVGIRELRRQGRLGQLTQALVGQAWAGMHLGNAAIALPAAQEARRLAPDTRSAQWGACASLAEAVVVADQGNAERAEQLIGAAEAAFLDDLATSMLSLVQHARGRAALAEARYDDAFDHLRPLFDPHDDAYHPNIRVFAISELAEAASQVGQSAVAAAAVADLEPVAARCPGSQLVVGLACARAMLATGAEMDAAVHAALSAGRGAWPSLRARTLLRHGMVLRRERRVAEARGPLRAARETFDALGFVPWAERARQELRASGETSRAAVPTAVDVLTPQELQIAQLAAQGLSNRQIGQRIFLSHRTVQYHLHRIFPKLDISTRAQLAVALATG